MNTLTLEEAVNEITWACRRAAKEGDRCPFFFVVGAGVSHPAIPLASEIEAHCKDEARKIGITREPPSQSQLDLYSHWFAAAYPNPIERQSYIRCLVENVPLSPASLRLAHLLLKKAVSTMVVTPNFDNFVSKALTIFGNSDFRLCDHPETTDRIDPEAEEIQIVHVHGTYWFYDLANLKGEIQTRAEASRSTAFTMLSLLDHILTNRSPIVIGYSGWEGDVIMTALRRRLTRPLPYRLYWFCFRRDATVSLPSWLKEHPGVFFVLPTEQAALVPETAQKDSGPILEEIPPEKDTTALPPHFESEPLPGKLKENVLSAQRVFDHLVKSFELSAPPLVQSPLDFYAQQMERSLPQGAPGTYGSDPYSFHSVIHRLRRAERLEKETQAEIDRCLETVRDAVRRSLYREAIQGAGEIRLLDLTNPQAEELMQLLQFATDNLNEPLEVLLHGLDLVISITDLLESRDGDRVPVRTLARTFLRKASLIAASGNLADALPQYDELIKRFGDSSNLQVQTCVGWALTNKGKRLLELQRPQDSVQNFKEVRRRFGASSDPELLATVATSIFFEADALRKLDRHDHALQLYDDIVKRFGDSTDDYLLWYAAISLDSKADVLRDTERREEALQLYDEVVRRFGQSSDNNLLWTVASSLQSKAETLAQLERPEEALAVYGEVVDRFHKSSDSWIKSAVAWSLISKGNLLARLTRVLEAGKSYDYVVEWFGESSDPRLRYKVASALIKKARIFSEAGQNEEAIAACDEALSRFADSSEPDIANHVKFATMLKAKLTQAAKPAPKKARSRRRSKKASPKDNATP